MVQILSAAVDNKIAEEINEAKKSCLLIDESKDNAGHEELAFCVQTVCIWNLRHHFEHPQLKF